jgi:hypothetical protein
MADRTSNPFGNWAFGDAPFGPRPADETASGAVTVTLHAVHDEIIALAASHNEIVQLHGIHQETISLELAA